MEATTSSTQQLDNFPFTLRGELSMEKVMSTLRLYGICILPEAVAGDSLRQLEEEYKRILSPEMSDHPMIEVLGDDPKTGKLRNVRRDRLFEVKDQFPAFHSIFFAPAIESIAKEYFRQGIEFNPQTYVQETYGVENHNDLVASATHFDCYHSLKFWVYLDDCRPENGPFECVPSSHLHNVHKRVNWYHNGLVEDERDEVGATCIQNQPFTKITAHAGALVIFDTDLTHRAGHTQKGYNRRILRANTRSRIDQKMRNGLKFLDAPYSLLFSHHDPELVAQANEMM